LASAKPISSDFVPLFPWFAPVLIGMGIAKTKLFDNLLAHSHNWQFGGLFSRTLIACGRNSLLFYMIHQPILVAGLFAYLKLSGKI